MQKKQLCPKLNTTYKREEGESVLAQSDSPSHCVTAQASSALKSSPTAIINTPTRKSVTYSKYGEPKIDVVQT